MRLSAGVRLGPYEIVAPLGAGGMGEVWRARDTRLGRDVALKFLPAAFSLDADRLARFQREAILLASLSHPNIAAIYSVEETPGSGGGGGGASEGSSAPGRFLVMELAEGETLDERMARAPIPIDESLSIARQVAAALEAAHEKGIIHRDLKPANVKVDQAGRVKVLDFGLARALVADPISGTGAATGSASGSQSPTLAAHSAGMTAAGVLLGTAAYMSPEQARGRPVDRRADIWAFGVVLFEMLSGKRLFAGETISDSLAAVLRKEIDWGLLPPETPPAIRRLLRRCLQKDPAARLRDAADARLEIDEPEVVAGGAPVAPVAARGSRLVRSALLLAAGALLAWAAAWVVLRPAPQGPAHPRRFAMSGLSIAIDSGQSLALSPDGRTLAYRGRGEDGLERVYVRKLDSIEPRPLPGTEGGRHPFFSPDGRWIGFGTVDSLKKVSLGGGSPQAVTPLSGFLGGTWTQDGSILFAAGVEGGLSGVASSGGAVEELLSPAPDHHLVAPWALPGGRGVLFSLRRMDRTDLAVLDRVTGGLEILVEDAFGPAWLPSGHIVFQQNDTILALPFDLDRLEATGAPFPVQDGLSIRTSAQSRMFAVAADGTLVYFPAAGLGMGVLVRVDRQGRETPVTQFGAPADTPRLSPDGTRVAYRRPAPNCDVWIYDLERGTSSRLTLEGDNHGIVWSPDGGRVAVAREAEGGTQVLAIPSGGGGRPEAIGTLSGLRGMWPTSWSARAGELLFHTPSGAATDVRALRQPGGEHRPVVDSAFDDASGVFSPDGSLIAYISNESGRAEVYVQPYPGPGSRVQVSVDGGVEPAWSPSGGEIFFRQARSMLAAQVQASPSLRIGRPETLFSGDYANGPGVPNFDVAADGQSFLIFKEPASAESGQLVVVLDWAGSWGAGR